MNDDGWWYEVSRWMDINKMTRWETGEKIDLMDRLTGD